jgi:hypothetical protein
MKGLGHGRSYTLAMHGLGTNEFADHIEFFLFSEDGLHLCSTRPTCAGLEYARLMILRLVDVDQKKEEKKVTGWCDSEHLTRLSLRSQFFEN